MLNQWSTLLSQTQPEPILIMIVVCGDEFLHNGCLGSDIEEETLDSKQQLCIIFAAFVLYNPMNRA